jgi:hypothetical protein
MSVGVALVIGVLVVAIGVGAVWSFHASRSRRRPFRERPSLTLDEIYATFYAASSLDKEAVVRSWREIADTLHVPVGKLRPSDSFLDELSPVAGWEYDDGLAILSDRARRTLAKSGHDPEAIVQIKTVDEYIRLMSRLGA